MRRLRGRHGACVGMDRHARTAGQLTARLTSPVNRRIMGFANRIVEYLSSSGGVTDPTRPEEPRRDIGLDTGWHPAGFLLLEAPKP